MKTEKTDPIQSWNPAFRHTAGLGSLLLGLAMIAGLAWSLMTGLASDDVAAHVTLILLGLIVAVAGAALRFGSPQVQKQALWILLVYWILVTVAGALQAFAALLWDDWNLLGSDHLHWAWALMGVELLFGGLMVVLLFRATPARTRDRYGANVSVSVGAVIAVVVVLNMLAFAKPLEYDFETLGRFGLSDRSKRVFREIQPPVRLSAIYSDARMNADTKSDRQTRDDARKHLARVMEFFEEIHRCNPRIEVQDASSDAARARLMTELRTIQKSKTGDYEALLRETRQQVPAIIKELETLQKQWSALPADSFLAQWNLGGTMADGFSEQAEKIESADRKIAQTLATTPLPDYVTLLNDLATALRFCKDSLQIQNDLLQRLGTLPATIRANAPKAQKSIGECVRAVQKLHAVVRKGGNAGPRDPAAALQAFSSALGRTRQAALDVSKQLETIAGSNAQDVRLVSVSRAWQIDVPSRRYEGMVERTTRGRLFRDLAKDLETLRAQTAIQRSDANAQAQRRFLVEMRAPVKQLVDMMKRSQTAVNEGMGQLTTLDATSKALLADAKAGKAFSTLRAQIHPLLAKIDSLKAPKDDALPPDLSGKNIIVLQAGDKVEVVTFNETWPQRAGMGGMEFDDQDTPRFFNGDTVLASRLLGMTRRRAFGRVLIVYLEPKLPPQLRMRIRLPQGDIPPNQLNELRKRLKEANFQVQDWNLAETMPAEPVAEEATTAPTTTPAKAPEPLPTILLVLPPAPPMGPMGPGQPPMPSFGPQHVRKLRDAIDDGAAAMFLTCSLHPRRRGHMLIPQRYALADYLRTDWGLDARTSYMLVEGIAGETPGKYQLDPTKTSYMPLNTFTDQIIGKPLQGLRMLWFGWKLCPIQTVPDPSLGVKAAPILEVPATMTNIWAVKDIQKFFDEIDRSRAGLIRPQYDKGDLKVPLTLAMAATREGDLAKGIAPARLVLLGMGLSLTDPFVTQPTSVLTPKGGYKTAPPPRENLDLAVNAAYWLIGKDSYIAAGPTKVEPVRPMSQTTQSTVWFFCVLLLPAAVIAIGLVVMMARRRS